MKKIMRSKEGGVAHVAKAIEEDLKNRDTGLYKKHITGLSDLVASVLSCRSANTGEWISVIPRIECDAKSRERYISRFLSNKLIDPIKVMAGFVPEVIQMSVSKGQTVIVMMDQSQISNDFQCLMVSIRVGERAIPIVWKVVETKGPIGFVEQEELLKHVCSMIPSGMSILLTADRFYGTSALVNLCKTCKWQYRVRLKGNLIFKHEGGETSPEDALKRGLNTLENATFNKTQITTNIGILHEQGHPEPWFIAMDCTPSKARVLDYGMRWGIEAMFADFKSRGFCVTKTHLQHVDRIEKMLLILTIALYWAVSTGMKPKTDTTQHSKKKSKDH